MVATYQQPVVAHLARGCLEAEGIECRLADEHIVGVQWLYATAVGGVKLKVRERDQEWARTLLGDVGREHPSARWITGDLERPRCVRCGCLDLTPAATPLWLLLGSLLLLGVPLVFRRHRWACRQCGATFPRADSS